MKIGDNSILLALGYGVMYATRERGTYLLRLPLVIKNHAMIATLETWHQRLVHLSKELIVIKPTLRDVCNPMSTGQK